MFFEKIIFQNQCVGLLVAQEKDLSGFSFYLFSCLFISFDTPLVCFNVVVQIGGCKRLMIWFFSLDRVNPKWVVYHSLVFTDKHYMRNVIAIDPSWLIETAPHFYQLRTQNLAPY